MTADTSNLLDKFLDYEATMDGRYTAKLLRENLTIALVISAVYIVMVFVGKRIMQNRPAYQLKTSLGIWSSILAVFSIAGAARTVPNLYTTAMRSVEDSICEPSFVVDPPTGLWVLMFTLSKVPELLDTAFLVLKKRPVIFLHWYHHCTVLVFSFYVYGNIAASGRYFATLNLCVHSVMYSYYALKSFNVWIPKCVSMLITFMQLTQMAIGVCVALKSYQYLGEGRPCSTSYSLVFWTLFMYSTYFILFANFFYQSYLKPRPRNTNTAATNDIRKKAV
ncbi:hypothetical protein CAPTEDRAFT_100184 [Capitella teleta]|uniref:Elongation of very long chain fatty acids protein n=1 Tax=Capitella teleta TaxID=283909 RepID=R7UDN1_CAPTE|nr:hypothetical protein CAPTEDRAFT_100184 [Capitella teleta]|eukprot:ELU01893.1 hypothetical protein CAPTEDRAFT_100184 [Capitella teleta]